MAVGLTTVPASWAAHTSLTPAYAVQNDHVGGEAVGHMALGIGLLTAQLVGGVEELGEIGPPLQRGEVSHSRALRFFQIGAGPDAPPRR